MVYSVKRITRQAKTCQWRVKNQLAVSLPKLCSVKVHKHLLFKMCLEGTKQFQGFVNFDKKIYEICTSLDSLTSLEH